MSQACRNCGTRVVTGVRDDLSVSCSKVRVRDSLASKPHLGKRNPVLVVVVLALTGLLATCSEPLCACSPAPRSRAHIFGRVTVDTTPVAGAAVQLAGSAAPACGLAQPLPPGTGIGPRSTVSGRDGVFSLVLLSFDDATTYCIRVSAFRSSQDSVVIDGLSLEFRSTWEAEDSVRVDLAFP
jgi:hypothetical protein